MSDTKLIPAIPELPPELFVAHLQEKLAIFIGAGASRVVGCKGWSDFSSVGLWGELGEKEYIM
ncbi:MAG: hypothetical protein J5647_00200 [Spirochaetaceae bacterium]|nr:hypothetical protein [Spirochaetaceae bacterium]